MRHGAVTLSQRAAELVVGGQRWDVLICSDMLNLAEFIGLTPCEVQQLPSVAYFHENQVTYPVREEHEFDYHFVFTNMTTALAASRVWFNSAFHRDEFLDGLDAFLRRMPDHGPLDAIGRIRARAEVHYPGIEMPPARPPRRAGPLHVLWAARWEFDKCPDVFFRALELIAEDGVPFRLSVIGGGNARDVLPVFEVARKRFEAQIARWGYQESRESYLAALLEADVVVSTSQHEFFGISVVEAVAAGVHPLVPRRLAYPEVLAGLDTEGQASCFHGDDPRDIAQRLTSLAQSVATGTACTADPERGVRAMQRYSWDQLAPAYDGELEALIQWRGSPGLPGVGPRE